MLKSELRKIYLARRKSLSAQERNEKSRQITDLFFQNFDLRQINFLHCFIAIERFKEIETSLIFQKIWRDFPHVQTLAPRVNFESKEIENVRFSTDSRLAQNFWQISEPVESVQIESEKIDLILVPLLCFDERGFRVGYGKGFYDKFLSKCRKDALKIGLNYFPPVEKIADVHQFDVRLNRCVTTEKIWKFQ